MTVSVTVKILPIYNELGGENQELKKKSYLHNSQMSPSSFFMSLSFIKALQKY